MNYDSMSVHELVGNAIEIGIDYGISAWTDTDAKELADALESALRRAVIRESSVGEISIEQHEGYMSPDPMFTVGAKSTLKAGEFYLVPKEKV